MQLADWYTRTAVGCVPEIDITHPGRYNVPESGIGSAATLVTDTHLTRHERNFPSGIAAILTDSSVHGFIASVKGADE
jgi:hypothetical protein